MKIGVSAVVLALMGVLLGLVLLVVNKSYATEEIAQDAEKAVGAIVTRVRVNEVRIETVKDNFIRFEKKIDKLDGKIQQVLDRTHIHRGD